MLYRSTLTIICLSTLQISSITAGKTTQAAKAATTDTCLHISAPKFLATLPTSAPATPQEKKLMRRVKTDDNFIITTSTLSALIRAEKIAQMKAYIQQLQEELAEKKYTEWLAHVQASNNSGYFPHSNYAQESFSYNFNSEKEFPGSHMCW